MRLPATRVPQPIVTRHRLVFRGPDGEPWKVLTPKNSVTVSGRARLAALAFGSSQKTFGVFAASDDQQSVQASSTGIGPEKVTKTIPDITVSGTFVELTVTVTEAELSVFGALAPIRRLGVRTVDGQFLFIVPIPDTVPPPGTSLTYVAQLEF